jgi:2-oxoglutarate dehydrogenase E2 component (dihydrolipoamide succinyltransferase)
MSVELKVPAVGESITEVLIGDWLKAEGDSVTRDEIITLIETDKVTVELPAPVSGVITQIKVKKGERANVGDVIGVMEERAGTGAAKKEPSKPGDGAPEARSAEPQPRPAEPPSSAPSHPRTLAPEEEDEVPKSVRDSLPPQAFARVMPSARRALKEKGLRAEEVKPSGPGGRLLKEDVERHEPKPEIEKPEPRAPLAGRREEVVPMSPMRKRIAERLVQSQQTAALLTTFNEIDMSGVLALRNEHKQAFQDKYGIKLGFMPFFVKGVIEALKLVPAVNAEIRGDDIVYRNYYDIGVAVGGGRGLVVPVLRSAELLSFAEIEKKIADFAERAKNNKLKIEDLEGGTFTISNGGIYGSLLSTPIINPPQSGILGMHAIQDRAVVRDGQVVVRPMMYIALTYDHRLVDGREAVTFLKRIKECVENPARILLEV